MVRLGTNEFYRKCFGMKMDRRFHRCTDVKCPLSLSKMWIPFGLFWLVAWSQQIIDWQTTHNQSGPLRFSVTREIDGISSLLRWLHLTTNRHRKRGIPLSRHSVTLLVLRHLHNKKKVIICRHSLHTTNAHAQSLSREHFVYHHARCITDHHHG